jgi:hypothetical protein
VKLIEVLYFRTSCRMMTLARNKTVKMLRKEDAEEDHAREEGQDASEEEDEEDPGSKSQGNGQMMDAPNAEETTEFFEEHGPFGPSSQPLVPSSQMPSSQMPSSQPLVQEPYSFVKELNAQVQEARQKEKDADAKELRKKRDAEIARQLQVRLECNRSQNLV